MAPVQAQMSGVVIEGPHAIAETHRGCCDYARARRSGSASGTSWCRSVTCLS